MFDSLWASLGGESSQPIEGPRRDASCGSTSPASAQTDTNTRQLGAGVVVELEAADHVPGLEGRVSLQSRMSLRSAKYQRPSIFAKLSR